jgi:hypothetical protein
MVADELFGHGNRFVYEANLLRVELHVAAPGVFYRSVRPAAFFRYHRNAS